MGEKKQSGFPPIPLLCTVTIFKTSSGSWFPFLSCVGTEYKQLYSDSAKKWGTLGSVFQDPQTLADVPSLRKRRSVILLGGHQLKPPPQPARKVRSLCPVQGCSALPDGTVSGSRLCLCLGAKTLSISSRGSPGVEKVSLATRRPSSPSAQASALTHDNSSSFILTICLPSAHGRWGRSHGPFSPVPLAHP